MTTYKEIFGKQIKILAGDPAPTPVTYTVTVVNVSGANYYFIDGVRQLQLELYEGNTYTFDQSDSSNSGHPLRFSITSNGTHSGGSEYTTGVTVSGTPGSAGAKTVIVVASGAPTLYYYCTNHSNMGGIALTPSGIDEYTGQIWFNNTTGSFRSIVASGAWASDSPLVTARQATSAAGNMSAMFAAGGGYSPAVTTNEEYNGSGWSSAEALPAARAGGGQAFGTLTAGVYFCGTSADPATRHNDSYEYDGTNWTGGGAYPASLTNLGSSGTQGAGLGFGGDPSSAVSAEYNGTAWTAGNSLNTARDGGAPSGAGTQTASLYAGGGTVNVEEYNGNTWSEVNNIPAVRASTAGAGTQTNSMAIGGELPGGITNTCVQYDGTNWAAIPNMATPRFQSSSAGPGTGALAISGWGPGLRPTNERYNFTSNTVTAAAWSSGGVLPQGVSYNSGAGTQTAALSIAGQNPGTSLISNVYEYNGSSWSDSGSPVNAFYGGASPPQSAQYMAAAGTQTAAIILGGGEATNVTVEYNGSSWTAGGTYPISQVAQSTMNGIQTAAINISGSGPPPGYTPVVANYNGSSWTASPVAFSPAARRMSSAGTYNATIVSGGSNTGTLTTAQEWNGSSWTTVGAPNAPKTDAKSTGIQTAALKMHGGGTESYDGSSWATSATMANNRSWCTGGSSNDASNTSAVVFGGSTPPFTNATEEFNGETTSANVKTLTSS